MTSDREWSPHNHTFIRAVFFSQDTMDTQFSSLLAYLHFKEQVNVAVRLKQRKSQNKQSFTSKRQRHAVTDKSHVAGWDCIELLGSMKSKYNIRYVQNLWKKTKPSGIRRTSSINQCEREATGDC